MRRIHLEVTEKNLTCLAEQLNLRILLAQTFCFGLIFLFYCHYIAIFSAQLLLKVRTSVCSKVTCPKDAKTHVFSKSPLKLVIISNKNPSGIS